MEKFEFLKSTRFWALVIGAVSIYLKTKGWIGDSEMQLIATITAGFTAIRTFDRASEQKVIAAGITSGAISVENVSGIPSRQ